MAYAKIENNIIVYKSYDYDESLTEIPDNVCCGMIQNEDGSFSNPPKQFDDEMVLLRDKRNRLLQETDWMASSDITISPEWENYRQNLRSITEGLSSVEDIANLKWPEKPQN